MRAASRSSGSIGSNRLVRPCVFYLGATGGGHFAGGDCDDVAANFTFCASAGLNLSFSSLSSQSMTATEYAFSSKISLPSLALASAHGRIGGVGWTITGVFGA